MGEVDLSAVLAVVDIVLALEVEVELKFIDEAHRALGALVFHIPVNGAKVSQKTIFSGEGLGAEPATELLILLVDILEVSPVG